MRNWPVEAIEHALRIALPAGPRPAFEVLHEVDSTNSELMRRVRSGGSGPLLLAAETQTAGRGRLGRHWSGRAGESLMFSMLMGLALRDWSGLSLAVGVALADSLDPDRTQGLGLKWPNDLWLRERKLAGILIETVACAQSDSIRPRRHVVVGVGINIGAPPERTDLATPAAWLREIDPNVDVPSVLLRIAGPLARALSDFETTGFAPYRSRFEARDLLRDRPVTVTGGTAGPLDGRARGVSDAGALLVQTDDGGMHQVNAMEVSVRPMSGEGR